MSEQQADDARISEIRSRLELSEAVVRDGCEAHTGALRQMAARRSARPGERDMALMERDGASELCGALRDERDALEAELTAYRLDFNVSESHPPRLREPEYFEANGHRYEKTATCRCCDERYAWGWVGDDGICLHCVDGRADLLAERDAARAWSARWSGAARKLHRAARKQAAQAYTSWQRACDDAVRLAAERDALRARAERYERALYGPVPTGGMETLSGNECRLCCADAKPDEIDMHEDDCPLRRAALAAAASEDGGE